MSELTKGQLRSDNNSSFPNNNTQAITPTILRDFNGNIIDSLVDEIGYNIDSGSWNQKIAAAGISGSLLTTASFSEATRNMTFTKADGTTFTTNIADGAAVATGSFLETASLANNGLFDMTFTKADGSTFVVNVPVASATGSLLKDASNNDNATTTYTRGSGTTFTTTINNVNNAVSSSVSAVADSVPFSGVTNKPPFLVSGSSQVSYPELSNIPAGILSGSIAGNLPSGVVSGSSQLTSSYDTRYELSGSAVSLPSGTISGSSQVDYPLISNIPSGLVSGSSQLTSSYDTRYELSGSAVALPSGTVSGSSQIDYPNISNIPAGIISGSSQVVLPAGTVSGSSQVDYPNISNIPGGIISGSSQLPGGLVSGSTFPFTGNAQITGSLILSQSGLSSGDDVFLLGFPRTGGNSLQGVIRSTVDDGMHLYGNKQFGNGGCTFAGGIMSFESGPVKLGPAGDAVNLEMKNGSAIIPDVGTVLLLDGNVKVSGSLEIGGISNVSASIAGAASGAGGLPSGVVSGSSQVSYPLLSNIPAGIISGSSQIPFPSTANLINTGSTQQTKNANIVQAVDPPAGAASQRDFFNVSSTFNNGITYNNNTFALQNYESFGRAYQDSFLFEMYDSFDYNFGSEFGINGGQVAMITNCSGSVKSGQIRVRDNYADGATVDIQSTRIQIGTFNTGRSAATAGVAIGSQNHVTDMAHSRLNIFGPTTFGGFASQIVSASVETNVTTITPAADNSITVNFNNTSLQEVTLPAGVTCNIKSDGDTAGKSVKLKILQNNSSASTVTFDNAFKQPNGATYTASTTLEAVDVLTLFTFSNGSEIYVEHTNRFD